MSQLEHMKKEVLRLVAEHDGLLSWYQLDRALAFGENLPLLGQLNTMLDELVAEGLILTDGEGARPRYSITDSGRHTIARMAA